MSDPLTAEEQFVVAAAAGALRGSGVGELSAARLDGPTVLSIAARHGVRAIVLDAISKLTEPGPAIDRDDVNTRRMKIAATNLMALSAARQAMRTLEAHGIRAMLAPSPAVVLMLEGVPHELGRAPIAVSASELAAARELVQSDSIGIEPIDEAVLSTAADYPVGGGTVRAPARSALPGAFRQRTTAAGLRGLDYGVAAALLARTSNGSQDHAHHQMLTAALRAYNLAGSDSALSAPARMPARAVAKTAARELWIAGFPSPYGGADTELDHLIDFLRSRDVQVHLVPMFGANEGMVGSVLARGCHIHEYRDDIFRDRLVASFCNGEFLAALPAIMNAGPPAKVIWFNCMTWLFDREREAHARGWIDVFGFQSEYQRHVLTGQLEPIRPVHTFPYRPYFNVKRIEWSYREWGDSHHLGRISRDDSAKYAPDTWQIFDRVQVPAHLRKRVFVLGYGDNAARKIGAPPPALDCELWAPGQVPADCFYRTIDTMVHKTGGSRENYPRVLVEAYAYGVVPIMEKDFGLPELVVHGETGFLTSSSEEMADYATRLAHDPSQHRRMAEQGRRYLEERLSAPDACWRGWEALLDA